MKSIYHRRLRELVGRQGSLEEQLLIKRWERELDTFLGPADKPLLAGGLGLEFGIEDGLTLKINLKAQGLEAMPALLAILRQTPDLLPWGDQILQQQLHFHCGLKLTAERVSREIYLYPKDHAKLDPLLGNTPFREAHNELKPLFIGVDDHRGLSMYFAAKDERWVDVLRQELGLPDWHQARLWPWQQIRFDGHALLPGKTALELRPLPAPVLVRFASHYPFPHFRYLIPVGSYRNGNFGRDPVTGRYALYATVN